MIGKVNRYISGESNSRLIVYRTRDGCFHCRVCAANGTVYNILPSLRCSLQMGKSLDQNPRICVLKNDLGFRKTYSATRARFSSCGGLHRSICTSGYTSSMSLMLRLSWTGKTTNWRLRKLVPTCTSKLVTLSSVRWRRNHQPYVISHPTLHPNLYIHVRDGYFFLWTTSITLYIEVIKCYVYNCIFWSSDQGSVNYTSDDVKTSFHQRASPRPLVS